MRRLSSLEVVEAHYERIEKLNEKFNALVTLNKSQAIQRANEADLDLARGNSWGPLHGVPVTIKDALETEGLRTTVGHPIYSDFIPATDAWAVRKLKDAGAIVLGKTNCAKLCNDIQSANDVFGATNNPWNVECTSGGSSGGEATAVALGLSPLGIGSDTGGSIRIPASYCGVFGLKTSLGKIPRQGLRPLHDESHARQDSLTVIGPIARSIRDLKLCYGILTGESSAPKAASSPKIYWTHEFSEPMVDDEVAKLLDAKFSALTDAGADVVKVEASIAFGKLFAMYLRLNVFEFRPEETGKSMHRAFWLYESLRSLFRGGAAASYAKLKQEQSELSANVERFMEGCDCWVLPATPSVAFAHRKIGASIPLTMNGQVKKLSYWDASMGFAYPINILGNPSVVIPIGKSKNGMPIGVQVIGKLGEDMKLLDAAEYLAAKFGGVDFIYSHK